MPPSSYPPTQPKPRAVAAAGAAGDTVKAGQVIGRRYRLDRPVARGGMGAIWAGWDVELDRPVAIKFMDAAFAAIAELRARFEREAKAAAQLRTPHVVQIFGHGVEHGTPYIVMELLEGEDLGKRLKREERLSLAKTAAILAQTAKALRKAHEAGIVHRDLKPQNVFLARHDEEEMVKVLDFGIAKRAEPSEIGESTKTGEILGSPHYMSPEQARGLRNVDHRTDLWALGIILYKALTGTMPFRGEAVGDLIFKICSATADPPSTLRSDLPLAIDAFFSRALARAPDDRFQSATEMAAAFQEAAGLDSEASVRMGPPPAVPQERVDTAARVPELPPTPVSAPSASIIGAYSPPSMGPAVPAQVSRRTQIGVALGALLVVVAIGVAFSRGNADPRTAVTDQAAAPPEPVVAPTATAVATDELAASPSAAVAPATATASASAAPTPQSASGSVAPRPTARPGNPPAPAGAVPAAPKGSARPVDPKKPKGEWGY